VPFHRPGTVGKRESRHTRGFVALDTAGKGEEFPDSGGTHALPPGVESFTAVVAHEAQEVVRQLAGLREGAIHLRDLLQLCLGRLCEAPLDGPASTRRPSLGSRLRRANEELTQAKQAVHAGADARAIWPDADTHCGEGIV
jgi:hypothetical protein